MAVNFCLPRYSPAISCLQLSADDHEVGNLISSDPQRLRRGFRAEHFIKPPIEVIISFPHFIEVSHIVLGVRCGSQQVSEVKLFSENPRFRGKGNWNFQFIGKCENITARKLLFQSPYYIPRYPFTEFSDFPNVLNEFEVWQLSLKGDANISCVKKLKICLDRVANSGIAVLSELQVWGQPSRFCDISLIEKIVDIARTFCIVPKTQDEDKHDVKNSVGITENGPSDDDIPSEFLDSITHEIMVLPMVLPSGNIVDQQTIEKCKKSQEIYGQAVADPFTGIPYHGDNQPIFNAALKARIDEFLVQKGSSLNVPRSIGTCENIRHKVYKSSIYSSTSQSSKEKQSSKAFISISAENSQSTLENSATKACSADASKRTFGTENEKEPGKKKRCVTATELRSANICDSHKDSWERIHEEKRKESLNSALQAVLGTTRRFTNFSKVVKPQAAKCAACHCEFAHSIFQLPCTHIMCRSCMTSRLQTSTIPVCDTCDTAFSSDCVERVFL